MSESRKLLRTTDVSNYLGGIGTKFVRGEIADGRLRVALEIERGGGKKMRLIDPADLVAYCQRYAPAAIERLPKEWAA